MGWLYRRKNRKDKALRFSVKSSNCWRGYVAEWEISRGRLYLTSIKGKLADGSDATSSALFKNYSSQYLDSLGANDPANAGPGTFAFWVSGWMSYSFGQLLSYAHMGYGGIYEGQLFLLMKEGFLVGQQIVHRQAADLGDAEQLRPHRLRW
jgi:hypothetical protein